MIYTDSLLEIIEADRSVIPSTCTSFEEQSMYVAEHAENILTGFFENVGINELAVYESTGEFVVYEGERLNELKTKAKEVLDKIWATIKAGYEKVLAFFSGHTLNAKKKFKDLTSSDLDKFEDSYKFGKTHDFSGIDKENFAEHAAKVRDQITARLDDGQQVKGEITTDYIMAQITGTSDSKMSEAKRTVKKSMIGKEIDVTKSWFKSNWKTVYDIVMAGSTKKDIKKSYKDEKDKIKDCIKNLKNRKDVDSINAIVKIYSKVTTTLHAMMNIKMDVCRRRLAEYTKLLAKVYAKKKVATKESFFGYQEDMIKEAFDW